MAVSSLALAFVAGVLSILVALRAADPPDRTWRGGLGASLGPGCAGLRARRLVRRRRAVCGDYRLFDWIECRHLPRCRCAADDRRRGRSADAALSSATCGRRGPTRELERPPLWHSSEQWPCRSNLGRAAARRRLESLRRSYARRGINPRRARAEFGEVGATMLSFGLGAALPLAAMGLLSREALLRWRTRLMTSGARAKATFAVVLVAIGVLALTGLDKRVETIAVDRSPQWLTDLTTRF